MSPPRAAARGGAARPNPALKQQFRETLDNFEELVLNAEDERYAGELDALESEKALLLHRSAGDALRRDEDKTLHQTGRLRLDVSNLKQKLQKAESSYGKLLADLEAQRDEEL